MKTGLVSLILLAGLSIPSWADTRYELKVDGLACPYCAYGIEKKIKALAGVDDKSIEIKLNEGSVVFDTNIETPLTEETLKTLINDAGFTLRHFQTRQLDREK